MNREPIIDVRDLTKVYPDGTRAVQGVTFQVARGEFFGFLGPNGAGKSTTIKILITLLEKTSGEACVFGQDVDRDADAIHRERDEPDFESEEVMEERIVEPQPLAKAFATPRSGHLAPLRDIGPATTNGNGHKSGVREQTMEEKIRLARLKGYEGDPCSECGQLTLVRSGACCKCDTCGATSGCS